MGSAARTATLPGRALVLERVCGVETPDRGGSGAPGVELPACAALAGKGWRRAAVSPGCAGTGGGLRAPVEPAGGTAAAGVRRANCALAKPSATAATSAGAA
jgi:hypothetical protein